jgi:hypothetical protein
MAPSRQPQKTMQELLASRLAPDGVVLEGARTRMGVNGAQDTSREAGDGVGAECGCCVLAKTGAGGEVVGTRKPRKAFKMSGGTAVRSQERNCSGEQKLDGIRVVSIREDRQKGPVETKASPARKKAAPPGSSQQPLPPFSQQAVNAFPLGRTPSTAKRTFFSKSQKENVTPLGGYGDDSDGAFGFTSYPPRAHISRKTKQLSSASSGPAMKVSEPDFETPKEEVPPVSKSRMDAQAVPEQAGGNYHQQGGFSSAADMPSGNDGAGGKASTKSAAPAVQQQTVAPNRDGNAHGLAGVGSPGSAKESTLSPRDSNVCSPNSGTNLQWLIDWAAQGTLSPGGVDWAMQLALQAAVNQLAALHEIVSYDP